ncbi:hypothetical protein COL23_25605 [Priestia aryabhattai]|uniref:ParA family protein n=1 Tax=Priestia aryabhattai TaxID=412384 RepID=UPI000BF319C0|nr:ParA family protein [Priestia aryabhattai]PFW72129.1 hypothetical protein COL23_25605 [Priestia aryabhattai]
MRNDVNIYVITAHKGGVTKTTSSFFMSHLFATKNHEKVRRYAYQREGQNTLVIDLDFQADLSKAILKKQYKDIKGGVLEAIGSQDALPYIVQSQEHENLYVLPATTSLAQFDDIFAKNLAHLENPFSFLESALEEAIDTLDIKNIVIDTSPSLNKLMLMGLSVSFGRSTNVLIPFQLDQFGMYSIEDMTNTLKSVKEKTNPNTKLIGLVPVLLEGTSKRDKEILVQVKNAYENLVIDTKIMRKTDIKTIVEQGFSEQYASERKALNMYYELFNNVKERV